MVLPDQGSGSAQPYRPQSGRAVTADARQHDGAGPLAPILGEEAKKVSIGPRCLLGRP